MYIRFYNCLIIFAVALNSLVFVSGKAESKFNDIRCRCTCKQLIALNIKRKVYTKEATQDECTCLDVVLSELKVSNTSGAVMEQYCLGCQCKYEVRSILTMQVVVILYTSLVLLLFAYMIIVWIVDFVSKRRNSGSEGEQERLVAERPSTSSNGDLPHTSARRYTRQSSSSSFVMQRITTAQSAWKRQVESQRDKVFGKHDILQ